MRKALLSLLAAGAALGAIAPPASAALVSTNLPAVFQLPTTGIWGPGTGAASFGSSAFIGSHALGVSYAVRASSGEISGSIAGAFSAQYNDRIAFGDTWDAQFRYQGSPLGGALGTYLGATVDVIAHALGGDICIYCEGRSLEVDLGFTPTLGQLASGSDLESAAQPGIGANFGVGSVSAGVDLGVRQDAFFRPLGVLGLMSATHATSGQRTEFLLDFGFNGDVETPSFRPTASGIWNIQLENLVLRNEFSTDFTLNIAPFVAFTIGFGCGNPGSNRDNGWFCIADDRAVFTLADITLYDGNPFALPFTPLDLAGFQITVVPVASSLSMMMMAGLAGLALRQRRHG